MKKKNDMHKIIWDLPKKGKMKILSLLLFLPILVFSQAPDFEYSFTEAGNNFGFRMTQNENYLFVGGVNKVFVYLKNNPSLDLVQELLIPVDIGFRMAATEDILAIGMGRNNDFGTESGIGYIFELVDDSWETYGTFFPADIEADDAFGHSIDVFGNTIVVGSFRADASGTDSGAAYVFRKEGNDWLEQIKLVPSDGDEDFRFGSSVAIHDDLIIVGSILDNSEGSIFSKGSAHVYKNSGTTWTESSKLFPSDNEYRGFGFAMDITENMLAISANSTSVGNITNAGAVYTYDISPNDEISYDGFISPSELSDNAYFGEYLDLSGNQILIGANRDSPNGQLSGSAFMFQKNVNDHWSRLGHLIPSDGKEFGQFGVSPLIDNDCVVIGAASNTSTFNSSKGFVYTYGIPFKNLTQPNILNNCIQYDPSLVSFSLTAWYRIYSTDENLVALVNPNGEELNSIIPSIYLDSNPVGESAFGYPVCNRVVYLELDGPIIADRTIRLYYYKDEIDALIEADPELNSVHDLYLAQTTTSCDQAYANNGIEIPIQRFEHYGENYFIEFESKNTGSYYLISKPDFISSTQNIVENIELIELAQNPVSNVLNVLGKSPSEFYSIFNSAGTLMASGNSNKVNVSHFINGVYFIHLRNQVIKFIKI